MSTPGIVITLGENSLHTYPCPSWSNVPFSPDFYENAVAAFLTLFSCDSVDSPGPDTDLALQAGLITSLV